LEAMLMDAWRPRRPAEPDEGWCSLPAPLGAGCDAPPAAARRPGTRCSRTMPG